MNSKLSKVAAIFLIGILMLTGCARAIPEAQTPAEKKSVGTVSEEPETTESKSAETASEEPEPTETIQDDSISKIKESVLNDFIAEADERINNARKPLFIPGNIPDEKSNDYPETFDLRCVDTDGDGKTENYVTSVKMQSPFGSCWAFASIAAAETSILYDLKQDAVRINADGSKEDSLDLSEHHLAWFVYTPLPEGDNQTGEGLYSQVKDVDTNPSLRLGSGSTQFAAGTLFAAGMGPVAEPEDDDSDTAESQLCYHGIRKETEYNKNKKMDLYSSNDDWSVDESLRFKQSYMPTDMYFLPTPVKMNSDGTEDTDYADRVSDTFKKELMNGCPVSIAYHADNYNPNIPDRYPQYINVDTGAHYTYEQVRCNHSVTIIGWDDNYPKENFLTEVPVLDENKKVVLNDDGSEKTKTVPQPPKDGAWIVKNSWGAADSIGKGINKSPWGVDGTGYFYLSYYDQSLETAQCFEFDVENKIKGELGKYVLQEYDMMPVEIPHSVKSSNPVSTCNVFTAEENQTLKDISYSTTAPNSDVTFEIYAFEGNTVEAEKMKPLGKYQKCFEYPGLHIFSLPESFIFNKGDKYIITATQMVGDDYIISVGSEFNKKGFDAGYCDDTYAGYAIVNEGESYLYLKDQNCLIDFSDIKKKLEASDGSSSYLTYDNFPIRAYSSINE